MLALVHGFSCIHGLTLCIHRSTGDTHCAGPRVDHYLFIYIPQSDQALRSPDKAGERLTDEVNLSPIAKDRLVLGSPPLTIKVTPLPFVENDNLANLFSDPCPQLEPGRPVSILFMKTDETTFFPYEFRKTVPGVITGGCCDELRSFGDPNIDAREGVEGLKQAYDYKLKDFKGKEIVGFFARANAVDQELNEKVFFPWNEAKIKNNISVRGYTVDDPKLAPYKKFFGTERGKINAKFLPESLYSADCSVEIFVWAVRIVIVRSKQAVIIESSELALAMKQIFELLWSKTKGEFDESKEILADK